MKTKIGTRYSIYIGLCITYILLSIINRKYPVGDTVLQAVYLSTWLFLFLWEVISLFVTKKGSYGTAVIFLAALIVSIMDMIR